MAYGASYFVDQDGAESRVRFDFERPMGLPVCGSLQHFVAWNSYGTREGFVATLGAPELLQWRDLTVGVGGFVSNFPLVEPSHSLLGPVHLDEWRSLRQNAWRSPGRSPRQALWQRPWQSPWPSHWQKTSMFWNADSWMNPIAPMLDAVPKGR